MRVIGSLLSVIFMLSAYLFVAGCSDAQVQAQRQRIATRPPDFAMEVFVDGMVQADNERLIRSKYLLQPNFNLHLSLGDEATLNQYPARFLKLRHGQFQELVNVCQQANLMAEPTSPFAEQVIKKKSPTDPQRPLIHVTLTSWGKTNHYVTTSQDSPPTLVLLDKLILFTGRKLPENAMESHRGY
jgi:hypothetical protein